MAGVLLSQAPTLDNTIGAIYLGVMFSCVLFGISALQVYLYYHFYPSDLRLYKVSVAVLSISDAIHAALTVSTGYHYGVRGFGNLQGLAFVVWDIKVNVALNVVIILLVQFLYAYRVWVLGGYHRGILGYIVAVVVLGGFAVGIVLAYHTFRVTAFVQLEDIAWAIYVCFSASTAIDIILSAAMCFYLGKSKGTERVLNSRISTLMQYTLSCGVFTSLCSVACLLAFIIAPRNFIFLALTLIHTRRTSTSPGLRAPTLTRSLHAVYTNSFMAMLNARPRHRNNGTTVVSLSSPSHQLSSVAQMRRDSAPQPPLDVEQDKYEYEYEMASPSRSVVQRPW
ncbi:hypothetical protein MKEN_00205300 [Mycena kentingensis (nom. inval.)]|nr:hypothetical protein MKEN_00205300 [Mycena kentingensis (nom. inval.)]